MSIITRMLKQVCVYWGPAVPDGDGNNTYPAPVEIACRWEGVEGSVLDPKSQVVTDNSTVYVDRDVAVNGWLYFGSLSEVDGEIPENVDGARKIVGFKKEPNFRATEFLRTVTL